MSRRLNNKIALLDNTLFKQKYKCPICNKDFNIADIKIIDGHHQTTKKMNISKACNSSFNKAMEEFLSGDCIWLHRKCHQQVHKISRGPCKV